MEGCRRRTPSPLLRSLRHRSAIQQMSGANLLVLNETNSRRVLSSQYELEIYVKRLILGCSKVRCESHDVICDWVKLIENAVMSEVISKIPGSKNSSKGLF